jgi:hypothetical protein
LKNDKGRIIRTSPAMIPQLVPLAPLWVNALLIFAVFGAIAVVVPKSPDSLVMLSLGASAAIGMIIDAQHLYSDAQALTVTAVSTNLIDHGQDRNLGLGEPLAVVVCVDVAAAGGGTLVITLQTDDNAAFSSAATVTLTAAIAAAALTAGAKVVLPVPPDTLIERFTRLNYTLATMTGITLTSFLQPLNMIGAGENVYYADAITIG